MTELQIKLCDVQGRLFENSVSAGFESESFARAYMRSDVARNYDRPFDHVQWAGEGYLMEVLTDEERDELIKSEDGDRQFSPEVMYWMGYLYRYWHLLTGESSREIYRQADAKTMSENYFAFHTMSPELAVEDLKGLYQQKRKR